MIPPNIVHQDRRCHGPGHAPEQAKLRLLPATALHSMKKLPRVKVQPVEIPMIQQGMEFYPLVMTNITMENCHL